MQITDFDYELPGELIAQAPLEERDASRMLVLDRREQEWVDSSFKEFPRYLRTNDVVVVNNSRVIPARLIGQREGSGGQVEIFLVREIKSDVWEALVRPGARLKKNSRAIFGEGKLIAEMLDEPGAELRRVRFHCEGSFDETLAEIGSTPLPPYIKRGDDASDRDRYQTVYAHMSGSVAAPTAGLHFTQPLLDELASRGIERTTLTLHVGYGTFKPVRVDRVEDHEVDPERYVVSREAADALTRAKRDRRRIVAVGTTTTRALESLIVVEGIVRPGEGETRLFIRPGHRFELVSGLVTNFHLPKSSLLILAAAFAGREEILAVYRDAVQRRYRFYSYGDAMLIV